MGLFSKKKPGDTGGALQIPDELAMQAAAQYGNSNFARAAEIYGEAIDKLHTMEVVAPAGSRIRSPGPDDQGILDGFNNSVGAALAMGHAGTDLASVVERSLAYLQQIAVEAGSDAPRYEAAIESISQTYRLGSA